MAAFQISRGTTRATPESSSASGGIPTRLATGLVYTDTFNQRRNVFVGHLWTQFHINGMWIDQDLKKKRGD